MHVEDMTEKLNAAISGVVAEDGKALVNRWLLVVETVTEDGRTVAYAASEGSMTWEIVGLARTAQLYAEAQIDLEYTDGFDDDDVEH